MKINIQDCYEELNGIDSWEDWFGTDPVYWYEEYQGYYPYCLGYVSDKASVRDYVLRNKGVWDYASIEEFGA